MRFARRVAGILVLFAIGYVATPYIALYRLGVAIQDGNAAALETLVDWDGVREGIKEDICDASADAPDAPQSVAANGSETLPPFGQSFMRGIAVNMIDQAVSAKALVDATQLRPATGRAVALAPPADAEPRITWAFFDGPTTFAVLLQPPGPPSDPVRIELRLRDGAWKVTRAWLPEAMLAPPGDRT